MNLNLSTIILLFCLMLYCLVYNLIKLSHLGTCVTHWVTSVYNHKLIQSVLIVIYCYNIT